MTTPKLPQTRAEIDALIPHAGGMCLLERVLHCDAQRIECETTTHRLADNPLRNAQGLPASAALEYAAQAAAVQGGLRAAGSAKPRMGYLAVLSNIEWHIDWLDRIEAPLIIEVQREIEVDGGIDCSFIIRADYRELVTGTMVVAFQ